MSAIVFIGDEVSAAGYRLAGAEVMSPAPDDVAGAFMSACQNAQVVFITAEYATHVPQARLERMIETATPLVMIIEDAHGTGPAQTIEDRVRLVLGLD